MNFPVFQLLNYVILLVVFVLLVRYFWEWFFDRDYQPADWRFALKQGTVSGKLLSIERHYSDKVRFFNWWFQVERLNHMKIPGDFAEVGVYKGDSARAIHHMDPERTMHLFDTFEGFPEKDLRVETGEAATYTVRNFADTSKEKVLKIIGEDRHVVFHKGYFPETTEGLGNHVFALVNLDADLYAPTRYALDFFYPRLSPGGVILIHDYTHKWDGIKRAVDEWLPTIPENLIMIPDMEGTVMVIKDKAGRG